MIRLYRGITVKPGEAERVMDSIRSTGLTGLENSLGYKFRDPSEVQPRVDEFFRHAEFGHKDIWDNAKDIGVFACGDYQGAVYYANVHNVRRSEAKTEPVVITFEKSFDDVMVDCRDFLSSALMWAKSTRHKASLREVLSMVWGPGVLRYLDESLDSEKPRRDLDMANLAGYDRKVIEHHAKNKISIQGRYGTVFCSAFVAKAPVTASEILEVNIVQDGARSQPIFKLDDFRKS